MDSYMIGYDLNRPHQDYPDLWNAIKAYGTWWHNLDSTWIIISNKTAVEICDDLRRHVDPNDELLVARVTRNAAWVGFNDKASSWLKEHLANT